MLCDSGYAALTDGCLGLQGISNIQTASSDASSEADKKNILDVMLKMGAEPGQVDEAVEAKLKQW